MIGCLIRLQVLARRVRSLKRCQEILRVLKFCLSIIKQQQENIKQNPHLENQFQTQFISSEPTPQ